MIHDLLERMTERVDLDAEAVHVQNSYKRLFSGNGDKNDADTVLFDMLADLKFLTPCENEQDMALCNYAKKLLNIVFGEKWDRMRLFARIRRMIKFKTRTERAKP